MAQIMVTYPWRVSMWSLLVISSDIFVHFRQKVDQHWKIVKSEVDLSITENDFEWPLLAIYQVILSSISVQKLTKSRKLPKVVSVWISLKMTTSGPYLSYQEIFSSITAKRFTQVGKLLKVESVRTLLKVPPNCLVLKPWKSDRTKLQCIFQQNPYWCKGSFHC